MATKQSYWTGAHFCGLRSQTNIYGLSKISSQDGLTKVLAVSIDGHFVTVEYQKSFDNRLIPITKEDIFHNTGPSGPGEVEIVSVDVISNAFLKTGTVLAVSILKLEASYEEKSPSAYLNIYFMPDKDSNSIYPNISDAINQSHVQQLGLDFIPFKLINHQIYTSDDSGETCLLLSGSDNKVHMYRQSRDCISFYEESDANEYFPEFAKIEGCVTQMELRSINDSHRLTVVGTQTGLVTLSLVNVVSREIVEMWVTEQDSPITSLHFFTQHAHAPCPNFLDIQDPATGDEEVKPEEVNLLVTSAIDPALVFCDVINSGLSKSHTLPLSNSHDVVLCSCVVDIDFDGENEILLGTYGQVLLAYKFIYEKPAASLMTSTPFQSPLPVPVNETFSSPGEDRSTGEQDKSETRRRHKSMAATLEGMDSKHEWHRADECSLVDTSLKDAQMARLVRSQENLAILSPKSVCFTTPDSQLSSDPTASNNSLPDMSDYPQYKLAWTKPFSDPVMALTFDDVMGDGVLDLVVLTLKGLHILEPDLNVVAALMLERLRSLCEAESDTEDSQPPAD
ncbi:KICSTOR complex protein kaptin-like isoform X2 [Physella acuta]|uniref:KICSTOR complex protein kaptin-like isoform X2 n=1 Tax=Physella acuta TaxID=109671 RepID=UPI0027DC5E7B|nr:KICSTOR complex protein kaptin-like isoform X2 [Physella acuta]